MSFSIETGFDYVMNFCVWVLEVNGLHVPPFTVHPDGDRSLPGRRDGADG